ncbi:IPT/TIG domain-containing protein [Chitinophaga arvensicola]|uniref:IPT/TIG domain-containing protein n=1 Tax=Chitinophaga arvensicola TaxID=29529 RepID=A0A1I0SB49_9BACT|nr:IPT/TIG domain-containing protein [Chitinophaga arvensicola]SEW53913.1 IPT/TIG domain-containing protein [Chitinophaga arvensicola]
MKYTLYLLTAFLILAAGCKRERHNDAAAMNVQSFWPNSGNAGTIVTLKGQGLGKDVVVDFNGAEAQVLDARDSILIVLAPDKGSSGVLSLKTGDRKVEAGTYTYQALSMHGISPANGPAGTNIVIRGAGFSSMSGPAVVSVNGKAAIITSATDTLLVAAVPEGAGTGKVAVKVDGKEVTGPDFTFQAISAMKPVKGGAGTSVTISGEGFNTTMEGNLITFNGKQATVVSAAAGKLVVNAPEGVTTGPVVVSVNGQKTIGQIFTVVPKPVIKTVLPLSAPAGAIIDITGDYFSTLPGEVVVTFNGHPAVVMASEERNLSVKVPAGAGNGNVQVTVNDQASVGPLFKEQSLGISKLVPDNGLAGTEVLVKGLGFSADPAANTVSFNGITVPVTEATDSTLRVVVPVGITTGALKVQVGALDATGPVFRRAGVITIVGGPDQNVFSYLQGIAVDSKGNAFVLDNAVIKKVTPGGTVSIFAGKAGGATGNTNGTGTEASFFIPVAIVIDAQDNLYICDQGNRNIRKVTPGAVVTTFAQVSFTPVGIGVDPGGRLYVGAQYAGVYKLDAAGNASPMGTNVNMSAQGTMAIESNGALYFVGDNNYPYISKISGNTRTTYAGGQWGYNDGSLATASFSDLRGLAFNVLTGEMYAADNNAIRLIADGKVTRITGWKGQATPAIGSDDGTLNQATYNNITGICIDREGNLYVVERYTKAVRKIILH